MSSPAQYIEQLRKSNQALAEGMVKYAETIVALRRELYQASGANTLDVMDRAYFAGKDAGIAEAEAVAAARSERVWIDLDETEIIGHTCECVDDGTFSMTCAIDFAHSIATKLKEINNG
jgi:hypothetical protein